MTNEKNNEGAKAPEAEENVAVSHVIGVSLPEDEYRRRGEGDVRTEEELLALGVEPDAKPSWMFVGVFVGMIGLVALSGVAMIELFYWKAEKGLTERTHSAVDPRLAQVRQQAQDVLQATAEIAVEDVPGRTSEYRFPIDQAIRVVAARPELLAGHPFGGDAVEPPAPSAAALEAPPAPVEELIAPTDEETAADEGQPAGEVEGGDAPEGGAPADDGAGDAPAAQDDAAEDEAPSPDDAPSDEAPSEEEAPSDEAPSENDGE